jgi:hypothetical protein
LGPTCYGGAFLLLRPAVWLYKRADTCLQGLGKDKGPRLVLTLFFKAVLGIRRIFHLETVHDVGFALLTGGTCVLSRTQVGGLLRAVPQRAVQTLMRLTQPVVRQAQRLIVSLDDHAIARFTRKFSIRKGFHTIRNKHMKVEKLFMPYLVNTRRLAMLWVSRGNGRLAEFARQYLPQLKRRARGATVYVLADAAAAANTAALLQMVQEPKNNRQVTIVRVPRRPAYRKAWMALPKEQWERLEEAGPYKDAPKKVIHLAQTKTRLVVRRPGTRSRSEWVRTIVVREAAGRGKERWHALWIFNDDQMAPYEVVKMYRLRQGHEQTYRVLVHDAYVDTAPSGYDKDSPQPKRPGFKRNALTLYGWIAALVYHALEEFCQRLPPKFKHAHPRTLRRWFFQVRGEVFLGDNTLIVLLQPRRLRGVWEALVQQVNRCPVRIPWLAHRKLILSVEPARSRPSAERAERARCLDRTQQEKTRKNQSFQRRAA